MVFIAMFGAILLLTVATFKVFPSTEVRWNKFCNYVCCIMDEIEEWLEEWLNK